LAESNISRRDNGRFTRQCSTSTATNASDFTDDRRKKVLSRRPVVGDSVELSKTENPSAG